MKSVLQNFKTGQLSVSDVPPPALKPGGVLVANAASLISAGTEKAIVELAKMNPLRKALARPDLVKKVLAKAGQEGLIATARIVNNLVSAPLPLGYSCAGLVIEAGRGITDLAPGMRVACAGLGYANHAEMIYVPRNLCVPIPDAVSFGDASFVTVGAIALHGVRRTEPEIGESIVVLGLGLVGQLTVQILAANGCRVFGVDTDPDKVALAISMGAVAGGVSDSDLVRALMAFTHNRGADAVVITAATKSSGPIAIAAELARDRGRVVAVGDIGMDVPRRAYYEKEIDLRLSRSYGPGRYDPSYEEKGIDYPAGYVRWTENRNMEAFLDLVAQKRVRIEPLISRRFPIEQAERAYKMLSDPTSSPFIGMVLEYDIEKRQSTSVALTAARRSSHTGSEICFGVIGAGQFAQGVLLPRLAAVRGVAFRAFATGSGLTARAVAEKYGAAFCTSAYQDILNDQDIDAVLIATRHDQHAGMTAAALRSGKHVFVEKPLAMNELELENVLAAYAEAAALPAGAPQLMVGFNRRFSPLSTLLKTHLTGGRLMLNYRVNAGPILGSHWHQDPELGGGRIIGEVCHFIDLLQYLTDASPVSVVASAVAAGEALPADPDNIVTTITFSDGSLGVISYASSGDPGFPKERLELFGGGVSAAIENWRSLTLHSNGRRLTKKFHLQAEKGHKEELSAFVQSIRSGSPNIPLESLVATTRATFAVQEALRTGAPVRVNAAADILK